jgi:hypothetical protein
MGKHCSKTKTMWGNTIPIYSVIFEKPMKLNSQPAQYEKIKSTKTSLKKTKERKKERKKTM